MKIIERKLSFQNRSELELRMAILMQCVALDIDMEMVCLGLGGAALARAPPVPTPVRHLPLCSPSTGTVTPSCHGPVRQISQRCGTPGDVSGELKRPVT